MEEKRGTTKGEKTKRRILEISLHLFADQGYHGTSMRDIAQAANVSLGLAYNYFRNKEDLLEQIFIDHGTRINAWMMKRKERANYMPGSISSLVDDAIDMVVEHKDYFRLLWNLMLLKSGAVFEDLLNHSQYQKIFERVKKTFLEKDPQCPDYKVEAFMQHFIGATVGYLSNPRIFSPEAAKSTIKDMYVDKTL